MFKSLPLIIKIIILWIPGSVALVLGAILISSSSSEITSKAPEPSPTQSRSLRQSDQASEPTPEPVDQPYQPTSEDRANAGDVTGVYPELKYLEDPDMYGVVVPWWRDEIKAADLVAPVEFPSRIYNLLPPEGKRVADEAAAEYRAERDSILAAEKAAVEKAAAERAAERNRPSTGDSDIDGLLDMSRELSAMMDTSSLPGWGSGNVPIIMPMPDADYQPIFEVDCGAKRSRIYGLLDSETLNAYSTEVSKQLAPRAASDLGIWESNPALAAQAC